MSAKDSGLASIGARCDPAQFAKSFGGDMTGMVKGATTTIAGQPALQLKDAADSANAYVTVSARPEFLRRPGRPVPLKPGIALCIQSPINWRCTLANHFQEAKLCPRGGR